MAVVNANYEFTLVDIGDYGRLSDASVFSSCDLGYCIKNNLFQVPPPRYLRGSNKQYPYVFVGDDAFPLRSNLINPYSRNLLGMKERIANYRISRARRIVENAFGIATSRFRVFRRPITANIESAGHITKAVVALQNYLMRARTSGITRSNYCPPTFIDREISGNMRDGEWRSDVTGTVFQEITNQGSNNYSRDAKEVRDNFRDYFCSEAGAVPWQWNIVRSTQEAFDET